MKSKLYKITPRELLLSVSRKGQPVFLEWDGICAKVLESIIYFTYMCYLPAIFHKAMVG